MYTFTANQIRISVRNLVEFICRSGDLDNRRGQGSDKAMEAGRLAHKKIQSRMGSQYQAEVPFEINVPRSVFTPQEYPYAICVNGRADGVITEDDLITIDEIKGTYSELKYLNEPVQVHKAQALCYAYAKCMQDDLDRICIRMTYINLDTEEIKYFSEVMTRAQVEEWFNQVITDFSRWTDYLILHRIQRTESIKKLEFPFEYRPGQRELVVDVYKTIKLESTLFIQAPTGVGKTISTVFPAVKAMGEGLSDKLFYLTAKTITRTVAQETFQILCNKGLDVKAITLTAKEKACLNSEVACNPDSCPMAKGHFDRVNAALYDMIMNENHIDREVMEKYAIKHSVCPFEFSLDATYWCDCIICDYNYVFDPNAYLKRYFSGDESGDYIFLVDEAHNLVDRAREMYSALVYKEKFLEIARLVNNVDKRLYNSLKKCNTKLLELKRTCEDYMVMSELDLAPIVLELNRLMEHLMRFSEEKKDFEYSKEVSELFFDVRHFLNMYDNYDENYITYCQNAEDGFFVKLLCVNPSHNIKSCIGKGRAGVFFSATLLPILYYKELLGSTNDYAVYAPSPFNPEKRLLLVATDVTSKYTMRNENEFLKVKHYIDTLSNEKPGNYMVFFPSYSYMDSVYSLYADTENILIQKSGMNEKEREEYLSHFGESDKNYIGFCVMGGIFSEGIDLKNESLIGCIIVGTGIPQIGTERKLLSDYYNELENKGFEYAYMYPGMNKVLQAAGRVIRTTEDVGVVALLDERFFRREYLQMFPKEWNNYKKTNKSILKSQVSDFWKNVF